MQPHKASPQAVPGTAPASAPAPAPAPAAAGKPASSSHVIHYPFWFGGSASSMAACVTHPLDLVKVRLQMRHGDAPRTMTGTFVSIVRHEGLRGLYSGLTASLLRQLTYSTTRFGLYEAIKARLQEQADRANAASLRPKKKAQPSFPALVAAASVAGLAGGFAGNAADVLNVRMQHDSALPPAQRRGYRNALHGLVRLARDEGIVAGWFRGVGPNSARAAAMTAAQLASYDMAKRLLLAATARTTTTTSNSKPILTDDALATHLIASFLAGVVAATVTSPIDVVKTRVMSGHGAALTTVLRDLYAAEGLRWMFKGWVPSFIRLGPHTIFTFVFLEAHRKVYRNIKGLPHPE